jgi:hypothetical protein
MKKNSFIIASIILLVLISGFFIWSRNANHQEVYQKEKNTQIASSSVQGNTKSTSTSATLEWYNYSSEYAGFSIDVPKKFVYNDKGVGDYPGVNSYNDFGVYFGDVAYTTNPNNAVITVFVTTKYEGIDYYFKDIETSYKIDKKGKIDNGEATFYSSVDVNRKYVKIALVEHGGKTYIIKIFSFSRDVMNSPEGFPAGATDSFLAEDDYNHVINSFKFLK